MAWVIGIALTLALGPMPLHRPNTRTYTLRTQEIALCALYI